MALLALGPGEGTGFKLWAPFLTRGPHSLGCIHTLLLLRTTCLCPVPQLTCSQTLLTAGLLLGWGQAARAS